MNFNPSKSSSSRSSSAAENESENQAATEFVAGPSLPLPPSLSPFAFPGPFFPAYPPVSGMFPLPTYPFPFVPFIPVPSLALYRPNIFMPVAENPASNHRLLPPSASLESLPRVNNRFAHSTFPQNGLKRTSSSKFEPQTKRARCMSVENAIKDIYTTEAVYIESTPLEPFYSRTITSNSIPVIESTQESRSLKSRFQRDILDHFGEARVKTQTLYPPPPRTIKLHSHKCHHHHENDSGDSESCSDSDSEMYSDLSANTLQELERKRSHPLRLHKEIWYNDQGEMNDGPLCRCSLKAQKTGIRHSIYPGETGLARCDANTNNRDRLHHYAIVIKPTTNFLVDSPTRIDVDGQTYYFEGYSLFTHQCIPKQTPACKIIRFNIEYTIEFREETFPHNFTVGDLDLYYEYVFHELLELVDFNLKTQDDPDGCNRFHFLPRFVRLLEDKGKEILSMSKVLEYLLHNSKPLIDENMLKTYDKMSEDDWSSFAQKHKGYIVACPGKKPCSIRVDQIDRDKEETNKEDKNAQDDHLEDDGYPVIVHFGLRPPQLSYAGNPNYQKAWREFIKLKHLLLANKDETSNHKRDELLAQKAAKLTEMRNKTDMKRDVTIVISSRGFYSTGLQCDIVQHTLLMPVLVCHLRFHHSLQHLETIVHYRFNDRALLQLALTHPSYRENFGTNPDHSRNTLTNCGLRQLEYGDRRVHYQNTRKRGINMLISIMSRFGCDEETASNINHNERLEFLGDAVVEFLSSIHLFFLFPDLEEGGLATYRAALVQNQHLAVLAKKLQLDKFMLYAHGSDLCQDLELRHAMANSFEAFMGALFLDGGITTVDRIFSSTLFDPKLESEKRLHEIWVSLPRHSLQVQFPDGDRHLIVNNAKLQELVKFEQTIGIEFKHIRLLARAFTHRSVGFNNLTFGSNQRMEFLGDTVLQLIASEYLYKFFPDHHEGHLSLLRSSLVNNKTQSIICDDLDIVNLTQYNAFKGELKTKDRADLLEAFLGALYIDKGLRFCRRFCEVCFFPRLNDFIMNQDWNDPKSKLQQCCLTLRSANGGEPDIPTYKVIESKGPTNTRIYEVAVYFRDRRLAKGSGHSIQEAEMNAATNALKTSKELFPHLVIQKKVIERNKTLNKKSNNVF